MLTESLVLRAGAASIGLLACRMGHQRRRRVRARRRAAARAGAASIRSALGFAVAIALASSVAVRPRAWRCALARTDVQSGLRDGGRGSTRGGVRDRLRAGLIVAEVALSLLLLFGAGLLIRSAMALQRVKPGSIRTACSARASRRRRPTVKRRTSVETFRRIADDAAAVPGVTHAAVTSYAAMGPGGGSNGLLHRRRAARFDLSKLIQSQLRIITPDFFATMRVPIVKGADSRPTIGAAG